MYLDLNAYGFQASWNDAMESNEPVSESGDECLTGVYAVHMNAYSFHNLALACNKEIHLEAGAE